MAAIKSELKKLNKDKLIDLVTELYKKNKSVKEFFDFYLNPSQNRLFEKYRKKVFEAFYPLNGYDTNLKEGKQAISDFKKLGPSSYLVADLLLFYLETGIKFTNEYGGIDERFYSSFETTYVSALKLMKKENLLHSFADRAKKIIADTADIGWGLQDFLEEVYSGYY